VCDPASPVTDAHVREPNSQTGPNVTSRARLAFLSLCAVPLAALHSGTAQAHEEEEQYAEYYVNNTQILSCLNIQVLNVPIASVSQTSIDCSKNYKKQEATTVTDL
jgi:hypothetical protein